MNKKPGSRKTTRSRLGLASERISAWLSNAIERRLNTENFIAANQTPFTVIHQRGLLTVRRYPPLLETEVEMSGKTYPVVQQRHAVPVVLVPPLAADPLNFDLLPNRSLVRFLLAQGFQVYLLDFGSPDADHSHLGLADYTTQMIPEGLKAVRADAGVQELSLLGYCMGGLFALIYSAWSHDAQIRNIVTIASPIDMHQAGLGGQLMVAMQKPLRLLRQYTGFRIHGLDPKRLNVPGWVSALTFKMTNPLGTVQGYLDLLMNLWDRDYVTEYQTMSTWFNKMHVYPGGIVQDMVVRVGLDNALSKGRLKLGRSEEALLEKIQCSLLAIAGRTDKIVTVEAAQKVMEIVGSADKQFRLAPGGHAGVFAGSRAAETSWSYAAEFLASRSAIKPAAKPGKKAAPRRSIRPASAATRSRPQRKA